jgi:monoamine oxidase
MWLSPTQTRLKHFAAQYEVATYPTHLEGDSLFRLQGKLHRGPRESVDGMFSLFEGLEYYRAMRRLKRLSGPLDCEAPWKHPQAAELDEITVEAWLCRHIRSELNMPMRVAHSVERLSCSY